MKVITNRDIPLLRPAISELSSLEYLKAPSLLNTFQNRESVIRKVSDEFIIVMEKNREHLAELLPKIYSELLEKMIREEINIITNSMDSIQEKVKTSQTDSETACENFEESKKSYESTLEKINSLRV